MTYWKPRTKALKKKPNPKKKPKTAMEHIIDAMSYLTAGTTPPAIPPVEDGGRKMAMQKYRITVVEKPTVVGEQGGEKVVVLLADFFTVASSERAAIFEAGVTRKPDMKYDPARLEFAIDTTPFGT